VKAEQTLPCPYCSHAGATTVKFTPWGGVVGPLVLSLVKCDQCDRQFNGRSGRKVEKAIRVYTWTTLLVLAVVAAWAIYTTVGVKAPASTGSSHITRSMMNT
jgi:hypothetical protein